MRHDVIRRCSRNRQSASHGAQHPPSSFSHVSLRMRAIPLNKLKRMQFPSPATTAGGVGVVHHQARRIGACPQHAQSRCYYRGTHHFRHGIHGRRHTRDPRSLSRGRSMRPRRLTSRAPAITPASPDAYDRQRGRHHGDSNVSSSTSALPSSRSSASAFGIAIQANFRAAASPTAPVLCSGATFSGNLDFLPPSTNAKLPVPLHITQGARHLGMSWRMSSSDSWLSWTERASY